MTLIRRNPRNIYWVLLVVFKVLCLGLAIITGHVAYAAIGLLTSVPWYLYLLWPKPLPWEKHERLRIL